MNATIMRNYNCKDEELPVICTIASTSLKRDIADFADYSPKFNTEYINTFEQAIAATIDVVEPQAETMERKMITERMRSEMDGLIDPLNRLSGYIRLAPSLKMSDADFGISQLRKAITAKDPESVIASLHLLNVNITKYMNLLVEQGFGDNLANLFRETASALADDKQKQAAIISNRRLIVQNNMVKFNILYDQLVEILSFGKILYKNSNAAKLQDYTFNSLKKLVHGSSTSSTDAASKTVANAPDTQAGASK